jgi:uncharacterized protein
VYWNVGTVTPPPANLVWYRFDETSGTSAADSFGNGRTGTLSTGASWTAGRSGGAVNLNGSNGYVSLPAGIVNGVTDATIATWVRLDTISTWSRVFDLGSGTGSYLFLTPRSSGGTGRFAITTSGAGGEQRIDAPAALPTGAWTHVAVTQAGNLAILYVNGAEVARNGSVTLRPGASAPAPRTGWAAPSTPGTRTWTGSWTTSGSIPGRCPRPRWPPWPHDLRPAGPPRPAAYPVRHDVRHGVRGGAG